MEPGCVGSSVAASGKKLSFKWQGLLTLHETESVSLEKWLISTEGEPLAPTLNSSIFYFSFLCLVLAYMLASCIFQTFHLWIGHLIYAALIVLFPFFLGFSVYKVRVMETP